MDINVLNLLEKVEELVQAYRAIPRQKQFPNNDNHELNRLMESEKHPKTRTSRPLEKVTVTNTLETVTDTLKTMFEIETVTSVFEIKTIETTTSWELRTITDDPELELKESKKAAAIQALKDDNDEILNDYLKILDEQEEYAVSVVDSLNSCAGSSSSTLEGIYLEAKSKTKKPDKASSLEPNKIVEDALLKILGDTWSMEVDEGKRLCQELVAGIRSERERKNKSENRPRRASKTLSADEADRFRRQQSREAEKTK